MQGSDGVTARGIGLACLLLAGCGGGGGSAGGGSAATAPAPVAAPPAPTISAVAPADASAVFTLLPAAGSGSLTSYAVTCTAGTVTRSATASAALVTVTGLANGTAHECSATVSGAGGVSAASAAVRVTPVAIGGATGGFAGDVVLASPTADSVIANLYAANQSGAVSVYYGAASGRPDRQTATATLVAGQPLALTLDGLLANTRYYYRVQFTAAPGSPSVASPEQAFQTARTPGSAFTFAIQGDSHPERERSEFNAELYQRTLAAAAADAPDFYLTSGDDFSVDTLDPATIDRAKVEARYSLQRPWLGIVGKRAPLFLVNGNHEQAARYLLDGTANNVAVWAQNARNALYSQPVPGGFYTGNTEQVPFIGLLRNYYAWTWGDALFVVIDPYWSSPVAVDNVFGGGAKRGSLWDVTHGDAQYAWLKATLEKSTARYKFVFAHHVMGTGRGGVELADLWEWGGRNAGGAFEFASQRPSWPVPIHQLMVANKVTVFFQGHDHIWVRQQRDGVTYQTLPEPADPNYLLRNADAYASGDKFPGAGYTRVSVGPAGVKVDYVRMYLPADEGPGRVSGSVAFSYSLP